MQSEYINTNLLSPSVENKIYSQYSTSGSGQESKPLVNSPTYDYYNQPKLTKSTKSSEDPLRVSKVIPKSESLGSSNCCNMMPSRQELLVPKSEEQNNCRVNSPQPPPPTIRQQPGGYDYMNQDSNSSSISSLEAMGTRAIGSTIHHPTHHVLPMQPTVTYPMAMVDDTRITHQMSQRSPYESTTMSMNDELYHHRNAAEHGRAYMHPSGVARPVVTYSNEVTRGYENSVVSAANHRPYDPGTGSSSYDRYDSQACTTIPTQQQQQQHLHARNMYYLGQSGMTPEEQERAYHQEAVAVQQHQIAMAASAASMMKTEDGM